MIITNKQKVVLSAIKNLTELNGSSPTLEEIRRYLGYKSTSSVQRHTVALVKKGALKSDPHKSRNLSLNSYKPKMVSIPVVGACSCGNPTMAIEDIEGYVPYNSDKLKSDKSNYFFLRASGTSMNLADIQDNDFVLCRKDVIPGIGDKVVALIGDEATIKFLRKNEKGVYLDPKSDNPMHKKIYLVQETEIQGKVVDVVRQKMIQ